MSSVEKVSNVLGDIKEEVVTTPLLEKKSLTKDVEKVTGELEGMKEAVFKILRKELDKFDIQSKVYTGWFKLYSGFLNKKCSTIHSELD